MPGNRKKQFRRICVTGGAGYVGAVLVPKLLEKGYEVRVLDLFIFGDHIWNGLKTQGKLEQIKGDIRDHGLLRKVLQGCEAVIHLACISNDPSFELNPSLGRSINFDAFAPLVKISKQVGIRRFIYASSSSVYGISKEKNVTEEHELAPLTEYSRYKALCEPIVLQEGSSQFVPIVVRPATICGYSPRLRLDLSVNILTNHAVNTRRIKVFGGSQLRPNLHIEDMVDAYLLFLESPDEKISGKTYNVGYQNVTIADLAKTVKETVEKEMPEKGPIDIVTTPADDLRSYHISPQKIKKELGFTPKRTIEDAVRDLVRAFKTGKIADPMNNSRYYNIKTMQRIQEELEPAQ